MHPVRQVIDDAPDSVPVPPALRHRRLEIIFWPLEPESDANGWPVAEAEDIAGSLPDFPEREA